MLNLGEVAGDVPKDGVDGPCGSAGGGDTGDCAGPDLIHLYWRENVDKNVNI